MLALAAFLLITGVLLTSCKSPAEKVEAAQNNVNAANKDLDVANKEYMQDIEKYRKETGEKITANEQSIVDFKARIEHEKKDAKADYNEKIAGLEQKNSDLKKKMDDYKSEGKEKWEAFKTGFGHDMDDLGKALKDLKDDMSNTVGSNIPNDTNTTVANDNKSGVRVNYREHQIY